MDVRVFSKGALDTLVEGLPSILLTVCIAAVIMLGLWQTEISGRAEGRRLLEESLTDAVVRHYAIEGSYPGSISFVEDSYGIHIDRTRYAVFYRVLAPNLMPGITVVELA